MIAQRDVTKLAQASEQAHRHGWNESFVNFTNYSDWNHTYVQNATNYSSDLVVNYTRVERAVLECSVIFH